MALQGCCFESPGVEEALFVLEDCASYCFGLESNVEFLGEDEVFPEEKSLTFLIIEDVNWVIILSRARCSNI